MGLSKFEIRDLNKNLKDLTNAVCKSDPEVEDLLQQILDVLTEISNKPEIEGLDPIPFCEDGEITGYIAYYLDEETSAITQLFFDATGAPSTVAPTGEACAVKPDVEFKWFEKERCLADGTKVTEVLCLVFEDTEEVNQSTFWIVNGVKLETDPGVVDCVECEEKTSVGTVLDWAVLK